MPAAFLIRAEENRCLEVLYLFVLVWAALPLVRTMMQGRGGDHIVFVRRLYRDAAYVVTAGIGIIVFEAALGISLENYWFEELGQSHRYWLSLEYRAAIFLVVLFSVGLSVGANLRALCWRYVVIPASAPWIVGFVLAALIGFFATPLWIPLMRFLGATATGVVDPVFGRDLSFYLLALPLYDDVVDIVIGVLCLAIALWLGIGLAARSGTAAFVNRLAPGRTPDHYGSVVLLSPGPSWADGAGWIRQGMILGALLCVALGISRFLARYHLVVDGHSTVVAGASYADVNFWLPGYDLIVACWFAAASILGLAAALPRIRNWLFMRRSHWLAPFTALALLVVAAFWSPPRLRTSMWGRTRSRWNCRICSGASPAPAKPSTSQGPSVEEREFAVSATPLTAADLEKGRSDAAGRAHLGLARARAATAADPGSAALLHVSRR